ncbi:MAG: hypothetical protein Q9213_000016 [Squamulea squamosa]
MVINPTYLAQRTRSSVNWQDAKRRVTRSYRDWLRGVGRLYQIMLLSADLRKAPEIQQMYSLNIPVSEIRTKVRQEFERHRYVNQLPVVDMLLFKNHAEYQVDTSSPESPACAFISRNDELLETITARAKVFSREGESYGKITAKLHAGVLGGTQLNRTLVFMMYIASDLAPRTKSSI